MLSLYTGKVLEKIFAGDVKDSVKMPSREAELMKIQGLIVKNRAILKANLSVVLEKVRNEQLEKDPSNPSMNYFAKRLLVDLDRRLGATNIDGTKRYELRFYSSLETHLDYLGGVDCWVEIYDSKQKKLLEKIKIDVTSDPNKTEGGYLADTILFVDSEFTDPKAEGKIAPHFFSSSNYINLLTQIENFLKRNNIVKFPEE